MFTIVYLGSLHGRFKSEKLAEKALIERGWKSSRRKRGYALYTRGLSTLRHLGARIEEIPKLKIRSVNRLPSEARLKRLAKSK